nr:pancreatic progenitor cell differentiation and proliferation factor-like protein isoform X1 [Caretta caretta]
MPTPCPAPGCHAARLARAGVESGHQVRGGAPPLGFQSRAWAPLYTAASRFRATQRARGARGALAAGEGSRVHPEPRPVCWLGGGAAEGESLSGSVGHPDCSEPVCLTFAPVRAFTMASVPSAGCLLAKNQYYRTRLNSESSVSSGSSSFCSDPVNFSDQEKAHHGLPELFDKCWWIKNFFHSETSASPNMSGKTLSTSSVAS